MISALDAPRKYGWKKDKQDDRDFKFMLPQRLLEVELARKVDLHMWLPPVYDQGPLGSCTGNAVGGCMQFDMQKQGQKVFRPSRLFIYYNERALEGTIFEDSGAEIRDGLKVVSHYGVPPENPGLPGAWPYHVSRFATKPSHASYLEAEKHQSLVYRRVAQTEADIRGALSAGFPIIFGFSVFTQFESDEAAKTGTIYLPGPKDEELGGHAVYAWGYDMDGYDVKDEPRVIVRNSWGLKWGQKGNFTMPLRYLTNKRYAQDFWTISKIE